MSEAYEDFWATICTLRELSEALGDVLPGTQGARSANHVRLNGLHVVAFAALEDFIRRRAHEVISWLGAEGVRLESFPNRLQMLILQGTIEGINFSLSRTDKDDRVTLLQLQGLLLSSSGENDQAFVPSEYFFGKAASNISRDDVRELLEAFGLGEKFACLSEVTALLEMPLLGSIEGVFTRLAKNRHRAAHGFGLDYKLSDFRSDMANALPLFAFAFDTSISQCAQALRKTVIADKVAFEKFSAATSVIRIVEFNPDQSGWQENRLGKIVKKLKKGELRQRLQAFANRAMGSGETIIVKNEKGLINGWIQPI
ncbi:TPA: hypothetical protein QDB14_004513 [Burkholderia vietnamiensis]|nr:hypothetical protein [Burkholderia vietnamiensis]